MLRRPRLVIVIAALGAIGGCNRTAPSSQDAAPAPARWDDVDESIGDVTPVWSADGGLVAVAGVVVRAADGARVMTFDGVPIAFDALGSALAVRPMPPLKPGADETDPNRRKGFSIVTAAGVRVTKPEMTFRAWAPKTSAYLADEGAQAFVAAAGTDRLVPLTRAGTAAGPPVFDATGTLVLYATHDPLKLVAVDVASGTEKATFKLPHDVSSFGWIGDRAWACSDDEGTAFIAPAGDPSTAITFDAAGPAPRAAKSSRATESAGRLSSCIAAPNGTALVLAERAGRVTLVDPKDGAILVRVDAKRALGDAAFDATGEHVALSFPDDGVTLVDVAKKSVRRLPGRAARFHPERPLLFLEMESSIEVRDATTAHVTASLRGSLAPFRWGSPFGGSSLVATAHDAALTIWDLERAAPRASVALERSMGDKKEGGVVWRWRAARVTPAFASFVRVRREAGRPSMQELQIQEAVFVRLADGARLLFRDVQTGDAFHLFAHTEQGEFDADDAALPDVLLRTGTDHTPASRFAALRRPGLVQAFFRGDALPHDAATLDASGAAATPTAGAAANPSAKARGGPSTAPP